MSESTEAPGQEGQGDELKSEYKAFREQVENASALLEFIIAEGHPYKVPDQIIETIECAREILKTSKLPPCTKRVEFLKAYRDLIAIPDTSVSFQGIPPTRFLSLMWLTGAFLTALVPLAIFFVAMNLQSPAQSTVCKFWQAYWFLVLLYPFVAVFTVWGFYVFTGVVTDHKLNQIIAFCYIFTILALLGATLPWWLVSLPADTGAPVALLQGCAEETATTKSLQASSAETWIISGS